MNWIDALLWGFGATVVLETIMAGSQGIGWSRMSIPFMLGTMLSPDRSKAYALGLGLHFVNGWIFALLYAFTFDRLGAASALAGASMGLVHGLFVLTAMMPLIPGFHPRMASETHGPRHHRGLQPPGFMALNYGWRTPITTLIAHVAYGAIMGGFYVVS